MSKDIISRSYEGHDNKDQEEQEDQKQAQTWAATEIAIHKSIKQALRRVATETLM